MPQMSPLPWLILMLIFILSLMMFASQMHHNKMFSSPQISTSLDKNNKSWSW
uniref:ATP synthase complex subunit 8 n=1 Tax=Lithobius maqinensis TaxID=2250572 RepID=A0A7L7S5L5_9MYRI|nr:ATP synthase F0 subunit 8 [Lithobius forficatus]